MTADLTLRQIRGFVVLCREGSFTAAAKRIGITQSGLSLLLQSLERAMSTPLIDRHARPIAATEIGKRFLPIAERIIEDVDFIHRQAPNFKQARTGRIIVAALPTIAAHLLPRAITAFRKRYPNITIQVRDALTDEIINRVRTGEATIGVGAFLDPGESLSMQFLFRDRLVAFGNKTSIQRKTIAWKNLTELPTIMMTRDSNIRQISDRILANLRVDLRPAFEVAFIGTAGALAAEGLGVAILPMTEARSLSRRSDRIAALIDPPAWREIGVLMRRNSNADSALHYLIELLRMEGAH